MSNKIYTILCIYLAKQVHKALSRIMKRLFPYLMYAGAIPFVFCAICLSTHIHQWPLLGPVEKILGMYGLVILSFLAGSHWGQHFQMRCFWHRTLPILSNVIVVLLWLGTLLLSFKMLLAMFVTVFVILLLIDYHLLQHDLISKHYFHTRLFASTIVIVSLVISGIVA